MAKQNFLLGRGERLTSDVTIKSGGGPKAAPYTFEEARRRLVPMLDQTVVDLDRLPADAYPNDQAIVSLTLNPEYIAKSYFPTDLMRDVGIEVVGSRPRKVKPEKRSRDREPVDAMTTELFARGSRAALRNWSAGLSHWASNRRGADDLGSIEAIAAPSPRDKIKGNMPSEGILPMEVVLHADGMEGEADILAVFQRFLRSRDMPIEFGRRFYAKGLCFLELDAPAERAEEVATFSTVRALRRMPELRVLRPMIRSPGLPTARPDLPFDAPISNDVRVAIFDGGVPSGHPITQWVTPYELHGMRPRVWSFTSTA